MPLLRRAANLDVSVSTTVPSAVTAAPPTADKVDSNSGSCLAETAESTPLKGHHSRSTGAKQLAADGADWASKGEEEAFSAAGSSHDGKRPENVLHGDDNNSFSQGGEEQLPEQARVDSDSPGAAEIPKSTAVLKEKSSCGTVNAFSSLATGMLRPKIDGKKTRTGKTAAVTSTGVGRGRREEARRRAELYEVCACA